jgi:hypothetical protein
LCSRFPKQSFEEKETTLGSIIAENPGIKPLCGVAPETPMKLEGSLFKNRDKIIECCQSPETIQIRKATSDRRHINNLDTLFEEIPRQIVNGEHTANCALCFGMFHISKLHSACGNCNNKICNDCGVRYYNSIKPGDLIQPANMCCAFCKKKPQFDVITSFNTNFHRLMGTRITVFDSNYYYAWCRRCNCIINAGAVACAAIAEPEFNGNFECEECRIEIIKKQPIIITNETPDITANETPDITANETPDIITKECPGVGCGVATEKITGCNHIECPNCNIHWCFVCRGIFTSAEIYRHMSIEHGGYGFGEFLNGADNDDDDDDY